LSDEAVLVKSSFTSTRSDADSLSDEEIFCSEGLGGVGPGIEL